MGPLFRKLAGVLWRSRKDTDLTDLGVRPPSSAEEGVGARVRYLGESKDDLLKGKFV